MALLFSTDSIDRITASSSRSEALPKYLSNGEKHFDTDGCAKWILKNNFKNVALQFSDELLPLSADLYRAIKECTNKTQLTKLYILADTSYGSCCVDEVAADHANCDAIIHFGEACLSEPSRLPVRYEFGAIDVSSDFESNLDTLLNGLQARLKEPDPLIVFFDLRCQNVVDRVLQRLRTRFNTVISTEPILPEVAKTTADAKCVIKCRRKFFLSDNQLQDSSILWIGPPSRSLDNAVLSFASCCKYFFSYDPVCGKFEEQQDSLNKRLVRRHYLVEKAKDAKRIGILVGTMGVRGYLDILQQIRHLIKFSGKRSYTFIVGKINVAKLANFEEIDIYVLIACYQNSFLDSKEFYRPIITPYELEVALNPNREWSGDYISDFSELLPGTKHYVPLPAEMPSSFDVSLVSGRMRTLGVDQDSTDGDQTANDQICLRSDGQIAVSTLHAQGAGEYFADRSWRGLEQNLGAVPPSQLEKGTSGIASGYRGEGTQ